MGGGAFFVVDPTLAERTKKKTLKLNMTITEYFRRSKSSLKGGLVANAKTDYDIGISEAQCIYET